MEKSRMKPYWSQVYLKHHVPLTGIGTSFGDGEQMIAAAFLFTVQMADDFLNDVELVV